MKKKITCAFLCIAMLTSMSVTAFASLDEVTAVPVEEAIVDIQDSDEGEVDDVPAPDTTQGDTIDGEADNEENDAAAQEGAAESVEAVIDDALAYSADLLQRASSAITSELQAKGLTEMNVKSLAQMGFSFEEQAELSDDEIKEMLGSTYGRTELTLRATRPSNLIKVTNVPDDIYGKGTEEYLPGCGLVAGDFYSSANNGSAITSKITWFANQVYGTSNVKKYYYLYGEWDSAAGVHKGVDLQGSSGARITSAHSGNLVRRTEYGAACIQTGTRTHIYAHMANLRANGTVGIGLPLGTQSNVGAYANHLHYETRSGNTTSLGDPYTYSFGNNVVPYNYMGGMQ